jgi:hypothetical protein
MQAAAPAGSNMALSGFTVVHARSDGEAHSDDAVLLHCFDDRQLVLAFVGRAALTDYFRLPQRPTMRESNLIVEQNKEAFAGIVTAKYERGLTSQHNRFGQSYPRVDVTLDDMLRSGQRFTADVLKPEVAFDWVAA